MQVTGVKTFLVHPFKKEDKYIEDKNESLLKNYSDNNFIVDLRNEILCIFDEMYQQLSTEMKYNVKIKPSKRKPLLYNKKNNYETDNLQSCVICGENRTINQCHIIPRELSGSDCEDNMIYLCPTHHFLFDQGRLSKEEEIQYLKDLEAENRRPNKCTRLLILRTSYFRTSSKKL